MIKKLKVGLVVIAFACAIGWVAELIISGIAA
jgi:hypothetical protein